jgi:hypothetical protein
LTDFDFSGVDDYSDFQSRQLARTLRSRYSHCTPLFRSRSYRDPS